MTITASRADLATALNNASVNTATNLIIAARAVAPIDLSELSTDEEVTLGTLVGQIRNGRGVFAAAAGLYRALGRNKRLASDDIQSIRGHMFDALAAAQGLGGQIFDARNSPAFGSSDIAPGTLNSIVRHRLTIRNHPSNRRRVLPSECIAIVLARSELRDLALLADLELEFIEATIGSLRNSATSTHGRLLDTGSAPQLMLGLLASAEHDKLANLISLHGHAERHLRDAGLRTDLSTTDWAAERTRHTA